MTRPISPIPGRLTVALVLVLIFLSVDLVTSPEGKWILREGGAIESVSAVLLAFAALLYLSDRPATSQWQVPVGLILLAMRELDFDKRFTSEGVLQLRLYSGDSPLWEKIAGAAVIALILVVLWRLVRHQVGRWMRALWAGSMWAWLMLVSLSLIAVAKTLDGLARKLAPWGIDIGAVASDSASRIEELFELYFAIGLVLSLGLASRKGKDHAGTHTDGSRGAGHVGGAGRPSRSRRGRG